MSFKTDDHKPLRQVEFDAEIFTDGYQPPDFGFPIEEVERVRQEKIFAEDMKHLHRNEWALKWI